LIPQLKFILLELSYDTTISLVFVFMKLNYIGLEVISNLLIGSSLHLVQSVVVNTERYEVTLTIKKLLKFIFFIRYSLIM